MKRSPLGSVGEMVGTYVLEQHLAQGGTGDVYRATHRTKPISVAVKLEPLADDPEQVFRRQHEADLLQAIEHPHLVRVLDYGASPTSRRSHTVMELLEGNTVAERLKAGPLQPQLALRIAIEAATGLMVAHGHGLLHRDVKPGNLFVTLKGAVRVIDFGNAKALGRGLRESTPPERTGTLAYMAPEQLEEPPVSDARSDIYALGLCVWTMIAGRHPFHDVFHFQPGLYDAQLRSVPGPLPGNRTAIDRAIAPMLAKAPDERYASMPLACSALLDALREFDAQVLEGPTVDVPALHALMGRSKAEADLAASLRAGVPSVRRAPALPPPLVAPATMLPAAADDDDPITTPRPLPPPEVPTFLLAGGSTADLPGPHVPAALPPPLCADTARVDFPLPLPSSAFRSDRPPPLPFAPAPTLPPSRPGRRGTPPASRRGARHRPRSRASLVDLSPALPPVDDRPVALDISPPIPPVVPSPALPRLHELPPQPGARTALAWAGFVGVPLGLVSLAVIVILLALGDRTLPARIAEASQIAAPPPSATATVAAPLPSALPAAPATGTAAPEMPSARTAPAPPPASPRLAPRPRPKPPAPPPSATASAGSDAPFQLPDPNPHRLFPTEP